ncbi:MAG TPA: hypothetical protein VJL59_23505 [Anaerolineales bacterium]|nr:hypothetical protein [Anaerolineales bacterium]
MSACSTSTDSFTSTYAPASAVAPLPTTTETLSPTPINTATTTPTPIVPTTEEHCPDQREIALTDLGLDKTTRLLVRPSQRQTQEVWTISGANPIPQLVSGSQAEAGWFYSFHGVSPDGKWLLFRKSHPSDNQEYVWLISVDGREKRDVLSFKYEEGSLYIQPATGEQAWVVSNVDYGPLIYWSAENQITLAAQEINTSSLDPSYPVFTIEPFSLEGRPVFASDETAGWNLGFQLGPGYSKGGGAYEIYKGTLGDGSDSEFFLYDRAHGSSQPVFQWLRNQDWIVWDYATLEGFRYWQDESGLETMVIIQPYGFDLATGLDFATVMNASDYSEIMKPVIIPPGEGYLDEYRSPNLMIRWVSRDGSLFSLEHSSQDGESQFYLFDLRNMALRDYCLIPRSQGSSIYSSPDGKLLAWSVSTRDATQGNKEAKQILMLEISTGRYARIADFEMLGWGKVAPQF